MKKKIKKEEKIFINFEETKSLKEEEKKKTDKKKRKTKKKR